MVGFHKGSGSWLLSRSNNFPSGLSGFIQPRFPAIGAGLRLNDVHDIVAHQLGDALADAMLPTNVFRENSLAWLLTPFAFGESGLL